ncbi:hypothetical protein ATANTOWER_022975 [Ataeniobius toweri]|uniref:Uncharacterized protein n=1 Tax=Ataeniobius toweri TaxID=208326 RepID=A0ABU7BLS6_9TELE|nr:hypothetical protein [Ataeniobius toweri]
MEICQPKPVLTSSCVDSLCSPGPPTNGLFRTSWFSPSFWSDHYPVVEPFPGPRPSWTLRSGSGFLTGWFRCSCFPDPE